MGLSITVSDPRFKFRTRYLTFDLLDIRLGATRLADVDHTPDGWLSRDGRPQIRLRGEPLIRQPRQLCGHYEIPPSRLGQLTDGGG